MGDRQFSISSPFDKPGEKRTLVFFDSFGGDEHDIEVGGKVLRFEWSERFGPFPLTKTGAENTSIGPRHKFWRAASLWNLQGRRLEGNKAIWHEPRKPVLKRLGGRHYMVIEEGEPGYDW